MATGLLAMLLLLTGLVVVPAAPAAADPGPPVADEFSGSALDTSRWTLVDPKGDATVAVGGGALSFGIPGGVSHDAWTGGIQSPRILQQVADADFDVMARFTSPVNAKHQIQGLMAVQDGGRLVRFDQSFDGTGYRLFAASFAGGTPTIRLTAAMPATTPIILRLTRAGDTWTLRWSADGTTWTQATSFTFELELTALGIFVGNAGSPVPAFTATVDYFRPVTSDNTPPAISAVAADPAADSAEITWTTDEPADSRGEFGTTAGYGHLADDSALTTAHSVTLTGLSCATTYHYRVLSTDAAGNQATGQDATFTTGACPPADTDPPLISNVDATPTASGAVITWTTDRPASSAVEYGTSPAFGQTAQDPALLTAHAVTLTGLACGVTYHYRVFSAAADGATATSPAGTFTTATCPAPAGLVSDDFSGPVIDPARWTFVDPAGNSAVYATGTNAALFVPSGTVHDMWTGQKTGAQLLQEAPDTDFEIETKFEGALRLTRQTRGLIVRADANTFLRFDESYDGSPRLFAATVSGSSATIRYNQAIPAGDDIYLRIRREGDMWTLRYSRNGSAWTTVATFTFALAVAAVGPYVGNGGGPAAVASVDYFSNTAAPVTNDDGGAPPAGGGPQIDVWYADAGGVLNVGARGFAQQWVDVAGTVTDPDGVGQLWYSVNGSPARLLSVGPNTTRLVGTGDFVAELDRAELAPGPNQVVLSAFDRLGNFTTRTITVNNLAGPVPALPDTVDWSTVGAVHDVAQVVDGRWEIQDGRLRTTQVGYDRLVGVGAMEWPDGYEVRAQVTIHSATSGGVGLLTGWTGHSGTYQPRTGHPYGALGWYRVNRLELVNTNAVAVGTKIKPLTPGVDYTFVLRAEPLGDGNSTYSFKVFQTGTPEPAEWDLTGVLPSRAGSVLLAAHHTDASFGTVTTSPLAP